LPPGGTSSEHHYHTAENEQFMALSVSAMLIRDDNVVHHIENNTYSPFRFLVFRQRNANDVVVYPKHPVMMIKSRADARGGYQQVTCRPIKN
jgi:uncharacterized cupin superfamily protein